jgi:membrane-associated phospholipid phosphatase
VALVYFGAMTVMGWLRPLPPRRRLQISAIGLSTCAAVVLAADRGGIVRDWAPVVSILAAYYLSGRFFVTPSERFEAWLIAADRRLLGDPTTRFRRWPRALLAYLEIVYVNCFLLVPAGFAALVLAGRSSMTDRYWTMVVTAELASFVSLALVQARPPWLVERNAARPDGAVHQMASRFVERFTIRANTFPSGHVAGSLAVAFALAGALPLTGAAFLALALSISLACVAGRYHYVIDVVAGAILALAIWAIVLIAGP